MSFSHNEVDAARSAAVWMNGDRDVRILDRHSQTMMGDPGSKTRDRWGSEAGADCDDGYADLKQQAMDRAEVGGGRKCSPFTTR